MERADSGFVDAEPVPSGDNGDAADTKAEPEKSQLKKQPSKKELKRQAKIEAKQKKVESKLAKKESKKQKKLAKKDSKKVKKDKGDFKPDLPVADSAIVLEVEGEEAAKASPKGSPKSKSPKSKSPKLSKAEKKAQKASKKKAKKSEDVKASEGEDDDQYVLSQAELDEVEEVHKVAHGSMYSFSPLDLD